MEYIIRVDDKAVDLTILAHALLKLDPSLLVDRDVSTGKIRCSTSALAGELLSAFSSAGHPLAPEDIQRLPSACCGGCSG